MNDRNEQGYQLSAYANEGGFNEFAEELSEGVSFTMGEHLKRGYRAYEGLQGLTRVLQADSALSISKFQDCQDFQYEPLNGNLVELLHHAQISLIDVMGESLRNVVTELKQTGNRVESG